MNNFTVYSNGGYDEITGNPYNHLVEIKPLLFPCVIDTCLNLVPKFILQIRGGGGEKKKKTKN